jgi:hypothetical protein
MLTTEPFFTTLLAGVQKVGRGAVDNVWIPVIEIESAQETLFSLPLGVALGKSDPLNELGGEI